VNLLITFYFLPFTFNRMTKIMNAKEMEQWLLKKGAVPVSKKIKREPWYKEVSKLPPCLKPSGVGEDPSDYNIGKKGSANQTKKNNITN